MSRLSLRIDKYLDRDDANTPPPQVFATIYAIDQETGRKRSGDTVHRELVPISDDQSRVQAIELQPGHYAVEVALPSGELLADFVDVHANQDAQLVLQAERSPNEWLGWQHLAGNMMNALPNLPMPSSASPAKSRSEPRAKSRSATRGPEPVGAVRPKSRSSGARTRSAARGVEVEPAIPEETIRTLPQTIDWLPTPIPALLPDLPGDPWMELGTLAEHEPSGLAVLLNGGNAARPIPAGVRNDRSVAFRVVHDGPPTSSATVLDSNLKRDFVAVSLGDSMELLSLPLPWLVYSTWRQAIVEIVVQQVSERRDFSTSLAVRDDRLSMLLGYLTSGALGAARDLADHARDMLYYKMENPLAAAAGGYALVGTASDNSKQEWHGWVKNLCDRFPYVPDGAIQMAQLHLRLRKSSDDLDKARTCIKQAYGRGLPFYSLGMRWLLDGLDKLAGDDPELLAMQKAVQRMARRSHPHSPFTILRLGKRV
jgi:hypothetical protein